MLASISILIVDVSKGIDTTDASLDHRYPEQLVLVPGDEITVRPEHTMTHAAGDSDAGSEGSHYTADHETQRSEEAVLGPSDRDHGSMSAVAGAGVLSSRFSADIEYNGMSAPHPNSAPDHFRASGTQGALGGCCARRDRRVGAINVDVGQREPKTSSRTRTTSFRTRRASSSELDPGFAVAMESSFGAAGYLNGQKPSWGPGQAISKKRGPKNGSGPMLQL
ncbi:hypothetical protein B0H13DRAFT_1869853 [Mycena leptocephala]|nr:hypothetical protein B0H13DRAFT_1869853 [Mycena leptocephala]